MSGFCLFITAMNKDGEALHSYLMELSQDLFGDLVLKTQYGHYTRHERGTAQAIKEAVRACLEDRLKDFEYHGLNPWVKHLEGETIWLDLVCPFLHPPKVRGLYQTLTTYRNSAEPNLFV